MVTEKINKIKGNKQRQSDRGGKDLPSPAAGRGLSWFQGSQDSSEGEKGTTALGMSLEESFACSASFLCQPHKVTWIELYMSET